MPQDFTLAAGSRDGLFSLSATASATFVGHDYSNSNTYRIDSLAGLVNGNQIVSFVHDDRAEIQDYYAANNIDTQEIDGFDRLIFTDSAGIRYTINTLFQGRNTYLESDSRDAINGRYIGVQVTAVCFAEGTLIRTQRGDVAVEHLRLGDLASTASGAQRPIIWIGHRRAACGHYPEPATVMPVRIVAHAFGENRPARDLVVSPGHAICVDLLGAVLIPAGALINGATIVQEEVDSVTYWHVELDSHDVILAENLPCESYLEMGNRAFFAEGDVVALDASPDALAITHADFCRPFHSNGPVVEFVRERLQARAVDSGWRLEDVSLEDDLYLEVDGVTLRPEVRGLSACFLVPAGARQVWLVSGTAVPAHLGQSADGRTLGICLGAITINDGFGASRTVATDDPRLCVGFHASEKGPQRWTDGRARLAAELWTGNRGSFFLRVELTRAALPRWVAAAAPVSRSEMHVGRNRRS